MDLTIIMLIERSNTKYIFMKISQNSIILFMDVYVDGKKGKAK